MNLHKQIVRAFVAAIVLGVLYVPDLVGQEEALEGLKTHLIERRDLPACQFKLEIESDFGDGVRHATLHVDYANGKYRFRRTTEGRPEVAIYDGEKLLLYDHDSATIEDRSRGTILYIFDPRMIGAVPWLSPTFDIDK
ncbi:MAG: hypothetical protein ACR2NP_16385, partial [Pirellulaceae bacterium]